MDVILNERFKVSARSYLLNLIEGCAKGTSGLVNIWSLVEGCVTETQTFPGLGGVQSLVWIGSYGLAACFNRSKVFILPSDLVSENLKFFLSKNSAASMDYKNSLLRYSCL